MKKQTLEKTVTIVLALLPLWIVIMMICCGLLPLNYGLGFLGLMCFFSACPIFLAMSIPMSMMLIPVGIVSVIVEYSTGECTATCLVKNFVEILPFVLMLVQNVLAWAVIVPLLTNKRRWEI